MYQRPNMTKSSKTDAARKLNTDEIMSKAVAPDGGYGWIVMLASFGINIIVDGIQFAFGVFYVEFLDYFQEGKGRTSFVVSVLVCSANVATLLAGVLVGRYGCRKVVIAGSVIATFGFAISRVSESLDVLILTYGVIAGFGLGLMYLPAILAVSYYFEKRRAFATGFALCGCGVGSFIFAAAGRFVLDILDWKNAMLIVAAVTLHGCVFGALFRPLLPSRVTKAAQEGQASNPERQLSSSQQGVVDVTSDTLTLEVRPVQDDDGDNNRLANDEQSFEEIKQNSSVDSKQCTEMETMVKPTNTNRNYLRAFSVRTVSVFLNASGLYLLADTIFLISFLTNLFTSFAYYVPFVMIVDRAMIKDVPSTEAAFLVSAVSITNTLGRIVMGFLADFKQVSPLLLHNIALLVAGVACLLFRFCVVYSTMIIYALIIGLCIATWISLTSVVHCELLGIEKLRSSFSLILLTRGVAQLIGLPVAGYMFDATGSYDTSFMFAGLMFLAGGLTSCLLHLTSFQRRKFVSVRRTVDSGAG